MEPISYRVRAMYERFPYPLRRSGDLFDGHPRLALSYRHEHRWRDRLHILDAGCGTGACSLGTAFHNPDCLVTAADFNREALRSVEREAASLGLSNLTAVETDLNTLQGVPIPAEGFDVIFCGGVIHHLADPGRGLSHLARALAPHGVMRLMVYNTLGRQALTRYAEALRLIQAQTDSAEQRLRLARALFASVASGPLRQAPWGDGGEVDDIEFVDRYLHPLETCYSVAEYLELLQRAGLTFLRWHEPMPWDLSHYVDDPEVLAELRRKPPVTQFRLVEHLSNQVMLDAYVARDGSQLATLGSVSQDTQFALNPQVVLQVCQQIQGQQSCEAFPRAYLRGRPSVPLEWSDFETLRRLTHGPQPLRALSDPDGPARSLDSLWEREFVYVHQP